VDRHRRPPCGAAAERWPLIWPLQRLPSQRRLERNPLITVERGETSAPLPDAQRNLAFLATRGPLTSDALASRCGCSRPGTTAHFFDGRQPDRGRRGLDLSGGLPRFALTTRAMPDLHFNLPDGPWAILRPFRDALLAASRRASKDFENRERHLFRRLPADRGAGPPGDGHHALRAAQNDRAFCGFPRWGESLRSRGAPDPAAYAVVAAAPGRIATAGF